VAKNAENSLDSLDGHVGGKSGDEQSPLGDVSVGLEGLCGY